MGYPRESQLFFRAGHAYNTFIFNEIDGVFGTLSIILARRGKRKESNVSQPSKNFDLGIFGSESGSWTAAPQLMCYSAAAAQRTDERQTRGVVSPEKS